MENEEVPSAPSTPVTPGTPGAPLFGGFRQLDRNGGNSRKSLLSSCRCFSAQEWALEEGTLNKASCGLPTPPVSLARRVGAEFLGTLILIFAGTATAIVNEKTKGSETLFGLAASNGLAVMIVVFSTGHISGAHLNPSITIAFAALKHFPWKYVPLYIGAQVAASLCASFALKWIFHPMMSGGVTVPSGGYGQAFALEFLITFNLMFVVTTTTKKDARITGIVGVGELAGIAVGATVMLNILIAAQTSGASMNPVRTLGPAVAANNFKAIWVYLTAPFLGALCGAGIYSAVKLPQEVGDNGDKPSTTRSFRR